MIITCQKCGSRLQVDETKIPTRPFVVRCPKCNSSVEAGGPSPALEQSATGVGNSPATENPRFDPPNPAPLFELPRKDSDPVSNLPATEKLAEVLSNLLKQPISAGRASATTRPAGDPRKVLLCVLDVNRERIARDLTADGYHVFVAEDTRQAVDRMRENELDMVLLDPRFDPVEQGAIFVTREVNILRPTQRRRLFFVLLSPSLRTMDAHTSFLNNVNGIINVNDIDELPRLLERRVREYNELYKEFNHAMGVSAL